MMLDTKQADGEMNAEKDNGLADAAGVDVGSTCCHMDRLTDDVLTKSIFGFVGHGYYRYVAGVSRRFRSTYRTFAAQQQKGSREDDTLTATTSVPRAALDSVAVVAVMDRELGEDTAYKRQLRDWQFGTYCAVRGSIELLAWGVQHNYRLDARTCAAAASTGHLALLQYAREIFHCPWNSFTCTQAARAGHFDVLQYAYGAGCEVSTATCAAAAAAGRLDILQWLKLKHCPWDTATCQAAAERGDLPMLIWCRDQHCPWDASTCAAAARGGHLDVLTWAKDHGADWSVWTCHYAAQHNRLVVLQYARHHGCPWNEQTCAEAAVSGHLDILRWARQHGCPWHPDACRQFAESHGHVHVAAWVRDHAKDDHVFVDGVLQLFRDLDFDDDNNDNGAEFAP
jgi:hypothetical protein